MATVAPILDRIRGGKGKITDDGTRIPLLARCEAAGGKARTTLREKLDILPKW